MQRAKLAIKLYEPTRNDCHVCIVKMEHIFFAAVPYNRSQTRGVLLYRRAASVILKNCHSPISDISKMSMKTLIYDHQQHARVNIHAEKLRENHKHLSIAHVNIQSMSSINSRL